MIRAFLLVARVIVAAVLAAQAAGALLFALVIAVEAADEPLGALVRVVGARLPALWAQASAVLGLCGVAVAVVRMRRQGVLLGLGSLGVGPRVVLLVGALAGLAVGAAASRVGAEPAAGTGDWERGEGGWIRNGEAWPDVAGGMVRERPPPTRNLAADALNGGAAGALGAALGLYVGAAPMLVAAALLLVTDLVARGLAERGVVPPIGVGASSLVACVVMLVLLLRAPLFPKRWG